MKPLGRTLSWFIKGARESPNRPDNLLYFAQVNTFPQILLCGPVLPFLKKKNTSLAVLVFFCDLRLCNAIVTVSLLMLLGESNNHKRVNCMRHACEKLFIWCNFSPVIDCTLSCPCFGCTLLLKIKLFSWWTFFFLSLLIDMLAQLKTLKYAETVSSWPSH